MCISSISSSGTHVLIIWTKGFDKKDCCSLGAIIQGKTELKLLKTNRDKTGHNQQITVDGADNLGCVHTWCPNTVPEYGSRLVLM